MRFLATLLVCMLIAKPLMAHSGGTDQYGCHTDSSTGIRHCHGGGGGGGGRANNRYLIPGLVLGITGSIGMLVWLFAHSGWTAKCADVPKEKACGAKIGSWILFGLSLAALLSGVIVLLAGIEPNNGSTGSSLTIATW